ncbi:MAG: hypothetical protein E3J72_19525 [Planctomycetota bacterium]|nr:MAG: hypothetical protein E3J72_19525 [Planctomycetota bacterium]
MTGKKGIMISILIILGLFLWVPGCGSSHKSSRSGTPSTGGGGGGGGGGTGTGTGTGGGGNGGPVDPPFGGSSDGSGGGSGGTTPSGVNYNLIVPGSYSDGSPNELLIVYSGTEGAGAMASNLRGLGSQYIGSFICAVLDGPTYRGDGQAGADVLDDVRANYNIDNDRTCLLGESAGTSGAANLSNLRQSYFAAYWANDITSEISGWSPAKTASELGFAPHGNCGPGGKIALAQEVVDAMAAAGYRLPPDAPYSGPGCNTHGDMTQFAAALQFFPGKSRQ